MISRPLSRLLLALAVTALLMPSAGAYPEGYPRIDGIRILDEVPFLDPNNHKGVVRTAYNRLTDEYLVAWLTSNGIRGLRLNAYDLAPVRGENGEALPPFEIVHVRETDNIDNPVYENSDTLTEITDFDIAFQHGPNRYFLAVKVQSKSTEGLENPCAPGQVTNCQEPIRYTQLLGNYLDTNARADIASWRDLAASPDVNSRSGIRLIPVLDRGSTINASIYMFWHEGRRYRIFPDNGVLIGSGQVAGRVIAGRTTDGNIEFGTPPHVLMTARDLNPDDSNTFPGDKTPDNGVFPFWLDDFDVAFDGQDRFLLAAAVGERNLFSDSNSIVVSSFIAALIIERGLKHLPNQDANSYTLISAEDEEIELQLPGQAPFAYNWTRHSPKVTLGPKDGSRQDWLVTFAAKHGIQNPCSTCQSQPALFFEDNFSRRIAVFAGGTITVADNADVLVGGRSDLRSDRTFVASPGPSDAVWLPGLGRYLTSWTYSYAHIDTLDHASQPPRVSDRPLEVAPNTYGGKAYFIHRRNGLGAPIGLPFALVEHTTGLLLQPIDLRWHDMSITAERTDGGNLVEMDETVRVALTVARGFVEEDVRTAAGDFDSGPYVIHLNLPDGVELVASDVVTGGPENGHVINGNPFDGASENAVYELVLRNANPYNAVREVTIGFVLEGSHERFDFDAGNDVAAITLSLSANPNGSQPPADGDDDPDNGGDDGDPDDGNDGGNSDDPDNPGDGDDDGNTGGNNPGGGGNDGGDDGKTGKRGGGGTMGWLVAALCALQSRRLRRLVLDRRMPG